MTSLVLIAGFAAGAISVWLLRGAAVDTSGHWRAEQREQAWYGEMMGRSVPQPREEPERY